MILYNRIMHAIVIALLLLFTTNSAFGMGMGGDDGDDPPPDISSDEVMPDYQRLAPISKTFASPTDVVLDQNGRLYVTDSYSDSVLQFSQGGDLITSLKGPSKPVSVAVDNSGRIYIGNKDKGNVEVYDADFNLLFKLGTGDGEFNQPRDIAIDASGNAYVADMKNSIVGIYDSAGNYAGLLGDPGSADGEFYLPISIAIDEVAQEIIVLDLAEGARVQFFDMGGIFLRSFNRYGEDIGSLIRPQHIIVDKHHRLYITDSMQNVVLVYDNAGIYLGAVHDLESPMRTPLGISLSETNRLYIASRVTKTVEVYGIDKYVDIVVDPLELAFTATDLGDNPASKSITIHNSGTAAINWGAVVNDDWLNLSNTYGTLAEQGQTAELEVGVDITGLEPGKYMGSITISAGPGATEIVQIVLTVVPAPILSVAPNKISFTSEVGVIPDIKSFTVSNDGQATLNWNAVADQSWIVINNNTSGSIAGGTGEDVTVLADVTSLAAGVYQGTITVSSYGAHNSPASIKVMLKLKKRKKPKLEPSKTPPPGSTWQGNLNRTWTVVAQIDGTSLNSIWGSSSTDIFAVGDRGTILHFDGDEWSEELLGTSLNLNGVWGASADSIYAVGESGLLMHYDGDNWSDASSSFTGELQDVWCNGDLNCAAVGQNTSILANTDGNGPWTVKDEEESLTLFGSLRGIWGFSESDIYVVGDLGTILHFDGNKWTSIDFVTDKNLYDVWGSATDNVYVVGQHGTIFHYNGSSWTPMESGTTVRLRGIWGNATNEVYAVGDDGTIRLNTGSFWNKLESGISEDLNDTWASQEKEIYTVGSDGSIIRGWASFPWLLFLPAIIHDE